MKYLKLCELVLGLTFVAASCSGTSSPKVIALLDDNKPTIHSASPATTSPQTYAANWSTYTNNEDNYTISYPNASDVIISHPTDALGITTIGWLDSSSDDVQIEKVQTDTLNLTPNTPQQWVARQRQQSESPLITIQDIAGKGWSGFVATNPQTQTVSAFLTVPSDYSTAYELTFQAGSRNYEYPRFWHQMLFSLTILPEPINCIGSNCVNWN